ncbi:MAG: universal stress protein [Chitinophagaceae bacterium]
MGQIKIESESLIIIAKEGDIKRILVPSDFSDNAMKAVMYAAEIAKKNGALVFLLHVIEPVGINLKQHYTPFYNKYLDEAGNSGLWELDSTRNTIASTYPEIKIETKVVEGAIANSIVEFAEGNQIDLIVMGTKGASGMKEIFMGSVAADTIGRTKVPVLAIPDEYEMEEPDAILFATDHFEENKELLSKIVELATLFSTTIHAAVFVNKDKADASDYLYNTRQLNQYMAFLKKEFPGITFKGELLEGEDFEKTIKKYNDKEEVDIIAMITYSKSFLDRIVGTSTTTKMAYHSKIPVLALTTE